MVEATSKNQLGLQIGDTFGDSVVVKVYPTPGTYGWDDKPTNDDPTPYPFDRCLTTRTGNIIIPAGGIYEWTKEDGSIVLLTSRQDQNIDLPNTTSYLLDEYNDRFGRPLKRFDVMGEVPSTAYADIATVTTAIRSHLLNLGQLVPTIKIAAADGNFSLTTLTTDFTRYFVYRNGVQTFANYPTVNTDIPYAKGDTVFIWASGTNLNIAIQSPGAGGAAPLDVAPDPVDKATNDAIVDKATTPAWVEKWWDINKPAALGNNVFSHAATEVADRQALNVYPFGTTTAQMPAPAVAEGTMYSTGVLNAAGDQIVDLVTYAGVGGAWIELEAVPVPQLPTDTTRTIYNKNTLVSFNSGGRATIITDLPALQNGDTIFITTRSGVRNYACVPITYVGDGSDDQYVVQVGDSAFMLVQVDGGNLEIDPESGIVYPFTIRQIKVVR